MLRDIDDQARVIAEDPILIQALWLVKNGVPFDIALSLELHEAKAWAVIFGTFEGGKYDWDTNSWEDRRG